MFKGLKHDVKIVAISVAASSLVIGVPAAAAVYATNSDKVDGKHAVGAKASPDKRAGKLVATNKNGLLPSNILARALDADLLDGKDSTEFLGAGGKATDADKLDGVDSAGFLRGGGVSQGIVETRQPGQSVFAIVTTGPGEFYGRWRYVCPADPTTTASWNYFQNYSSSTTDVYVSRAGSDGTWFQSLAPGEEMFIRDAAAAGPNGADIYTWTFVNDSLSRVVTAQTTSRRTATGCTFSSQAIETPAL